MLKKITLLFFVLASLSAFSQVNILNGLAAYYPFNGNANDSSGNGNNGTIIGATLAKDKDSTANTCYFFDGQDQYINVPAATSIQPTGAISVSAWVNTTDKDYWNFAVCKRLNQAMEPGNSYFLGTTGNIPGGSKWQWSISDATTQHFLVTTTLVEENKWLHIVGTFNGHELEFFLNGKSIGTKTISHTAISYSNLTLKLGVGIPTSSGNKTAWKGYMDEIRIYNRVLTHAEIRYLHNPATLSAENIDAPKIEVVAYPSPANDRVFISSPVALDVLYSSPIIVSDVLGKQVMSTTYSQEGIDVSSLATGVYTISIANLNTTVRFVKE